MRKIRLSAGTIEYEDMGGNGPVLVLLHGLAQNGSVWRRVVAELRPNHRCVVPTLPLGGHRPMRTDADTCRCTASPGSWRSLWSDWICAP